MNRWMIGLLVLWPAAALGQTGFYDHFEGNALLPHWRVPPASHWEYNVSNSMLHVPRVLYPGKPPHTPNNAIWISAGFKPVPGDFQAVARMGWDAGELGAVVVSFTGTDPRGRPAFVAEFGYGANFLFAKTASTRSQLFPAPPPGMYDFAIQRIGDQIDFLLDGRLLVTLPDVVGAPPAWITLGFIEPAAQPSPGALHVDLVQVVPAPASSVAMVMLGLALMKRRRR